MNKKQLYSQIREIRNKHFPPVLEFGSEVEHIKDKSIDRITNLTKEINAPNGSWELNLYNEHIWGIYAFRGERKTFEILGKPVTLSEIMIMLPFRWIITRDGSLGEFSEKRDILIDVYTTLNLYKPIQDQSEEVLEKILEIIK